MRTITLTDDIDGSTGASERKFSIGSTQYVIDLTDVNWETFLKMVGPYIARSRISTEKREVNATVRTSEDRMKIRAWAVANGRHIPSRGRFPNDVIRDYYATMDREAVEFVLS